MHTTIRCAKRIYRLAETRGHAFDARVYVEHRQDGWSAEGAMFYARRAYTGRTPAYRRIVRTWTWA
jgi:hypothetical protein